jgi:hypothetical protein
MARPSSLLAVCLLVCAAGLAGPSTAGANPDVKACEGKREGEACGMMKLVKPPDGGELRRTTVPGVCRPEQCCDLDYSKGSPPETVCHACLVCKEGPADVTPPPAKAGDPPPAAGGEPPRTSDGGPPPTAPTEQRGCTAGRDAHGPARWLPALVLLVVARRRRRAA